MRAGPQQAGTRRALPPPDAPPGGPRSPSAVIRRQGPDVAYRARGSRSTPLIAALALPLASATASAPRWLDARDLGASGSRFETVAKTVAGSREVEVADPGDFRVGQGVMLSRCNIQHTPIQLWGTGEPYRNRKPLDGSVEVRGYDGGAGSWVIYLLDLAPSDKPAFRWSADLGRNWHPPTPVTHDWQPLDSGVEVRLHPRDWNSGYVIAFGARDQLVSRIGKIDGKRLTLEHPANRTVPDALLRHNDTFALQAAVDRALKERRDLLVPVGHYRLAHTIRVPDASSIVIEGASATETTLDISDGEGACFTLSGGTSVTIRNFRMIGFMGFDERDRAGYIKTRGSTYIWGFGLKPCNAITIGGTERVLVENCHGSRMSGECFVSSGISRAASARTGRPHSRWITYLRCSVTDSARNAFNDVMCGTENTAVLNCRIVDVGGCSWEGASRFVKFVGNYVRNGGTVAMGNLGPSNRDDSYPDLGAGQHLVADNVFEGGVPYGGCAVRSAVGATQVIVRNNLFVNFNSSAVEASGATDPLHYPSGNTTITGNIFDMSPAGADAPANRVAIDVSADDTIVADNQVYVRGTPDPALVALRVREPASNLIVHDNIFRDCATGILAEPARGTVASAIDGRTFTRTNAPSGLPLDRVRPARCRGWQIAWLDAKGHPDGTLSTIAGFDPATLRFTLREARAIRDGDRFEVVAPSLNWNLHDNTISNCLRPVCLGARGGASSLFQRNLIVRGDAPPATRAIECTGQFLLHDNREIGFAQPSPAPPARP